MRRHLGSIVLVLAALACVIAGCSLVIDSTPYLRPGCTYSFRNALSGSGTCRQFLCRPAGYEDFSVVANETDDSGVSTFNAHFGTMPPASFQAGNFDLTTGAGGLELTSGDRHFASRGGPPVVGAATLMITDLIAPVPGADGVCTGAIRGAIEADLVEILGDGSVGTESVILSIVLGG